MRHRQFWMAVAGALALAEAAFAAGEVRTRMYGEPVVAAATDRRVVTRTVAEEFPPAAGVSPFAFSILPGASVPSEDWSVAGLRLNLFAGRHRDLCGIDVGGLGNELTGELRGIQGAGVWNRVGGAPAAIQGAGIANLCEKDFCGVQSAGIYNRTGGILTGLQAGFVNRASGLAGVQVGAFNSIAAGSGVQIGVLNMARALEGLQIGLFNVNENSTVPYLPIVNLAF